MKTTSMKRSLFILLFILVTFFVSRAYAETLHLSIAASMTDAVKEIIATFSKDHKEIRCLPNFASSGSLAKQIEQGAPADIYVSANPKWMRYLKEKQLINPENNAIFAFNQLVFIKTESSSTPDITSITSLDRIAIGNPASVPAGRYAEQAMENGQIYSKLKEAKKLVLAKDVRQALLYADRGEVDGAFVYKTDALLAKNAKIAFSVPQELYNRVSYPVGITSEGKKKKVAQVFYDFMTGDKAAKILKQYGFVPAKP